MGEGRGGGAIRFSVTKIAIRNQPWKQYVHF